MEVDHTLAVMERVLRSENGETPLPGPSRITLFPTNICNLTCEHCWRVWADYDKTYKSEMSDERLLALVDEARDLGVDQWYFVGGGDPMARGKVVMEMCRKIGEYGMSAGIHTNGTLFKPWMFDKIFEYNITSIVVSLDGPTAAINDRIRTGGFDKACAALRKIVEMKRARKSKFPKLTVYSTITNLSCDKIVDFVELMHDIGGSDIQYEVSMLIVEGPDSAQFEMTPEQIEEFPEHIRKGIARAKALRVPNNFERYLTPRAHSDGFGRLDNMPASYSGDLADAMCYEPWGAVSILPDGKLGPCCAFDSREDALSIKELSFAEVWRGRYMNEVRQGMVDGHPPAYCDRCPSNLFEAKEACRVACNRTITVQRNWKESGVMSRAKHVAGRVVDIFRRHGPVEGVSKVWLKARIFMISRRASARR